MTKIAVLGGGQIGEALVSGLVAAGFPAGDVVVTNRRTSRSRELEEAYGVVTSSDNEQAIEGADYAFLCVKPYAIIDLLESLHPSKETVIVSMAAGLTLEALEAAVPQEVPVIRVMPNTPMLVGAGMSTLASGKAVTEEQTAQAVKLLESVGEVAVIADKDMDAAAALQGSAPAYFFLIAEALIDAGVQLGLTRDSAQKLVTQTVAGAGKMLTDSGRDPVTLRANVTSPGGTTAAALRELEESGLRGAFFRAAEACAERSKELG